MFLWKAWKYKLVTTLPISIYALFLFNWPQTFQGKLAFRKSLWMLSYPCRRSFHRFSGDSSETLWETWYVRHRKPCTRENTIHLWSSCNTSLSFIIHEKAFSQPIFINFQHFPLTWIVFPKRRSKWQALIVKSFLSLSCVRPLCHVLGRI